MKKLDKVLEKNGFLYTQLARQDTKAIYQQQDKITEKVLSYEVFKIKVVKDSEVFGAFVEEHEKFPSNNDFGITAWSVRDKEKAFRRYLSI